MRVVAPIIFVLSLAGCGTEPPSVPLPKGATGDALPSNQRTDGIEVPPGNENCPFGGTQIVTYRDRDESKSYNETIDVIVSIEYQCRDGQDGIDTDGDGTIDMPPPADGNIPPVAIASGALTPSGSAVAIPLLATDTDGSVAAFKLGRQAQNGTVQILGDTATYTPNSGYSGPDTFTFTVEDDLGKSSGEAQINVLVGGRALFVADFSASHPRDVMMENLMKDLGLVVSVVDDDSLETQSADGMDLVFVSETVQSGSVGTKLNALTVPAIVWDGLVCRNMALTDPGEILRVQDQADVAVRAVGHPALMGLKGTLTISTMPALLGYFTTVADALPLTSLAGDDTKPTSFIVNAGKKDWNNEIIPGRRICMPWFTYSSSDATVTEQGKALFKAYAHYAVAP